MGNRGPVDVGTLLNEIFLESDLPPDIKQLIYNNKANQKPGPEQLREKLEAQDT